MGSFDPIHIGHLNIIREVLNSGLVDRIIVVPSGHNPWKKEEPAPLDIRAFMIRSAIKLFGSKCEVSTIESTFEPPFTSNKPLNHFRELYKNDELYIICGTDTASKIPYWKNALTEILPFYSIIAVDRGDLNNEESSDIYTVIGPDAKQYVCKRIMTSPLNVSSTEIRKLINEGKSVYPLVPISVLLTIENAGLYKD